VAIAERLTAEGVPGAQDAAVAHDAGATHPERIAADPHPNGGGGEVVNDPLADGDPNVIAAEEASFP
jgi:hypothetical protein